MAFGDEQGKEKRLATFKRTEGRGLSKTFVWIVLLRRNTEIGGTRKGNMYK